MGVSGYYSDQHVADILADGWATWAKEKVKPRSKVGEGWEGRWSASGLNASSTTCASRRSPRT
jgi:hypothetical protein